MRKNLQLSRCASRLEAIPCPAGLSPPPPSIRGARARDSSSTAPYCGDPGASVQERQGRCGESKCGGVAAGAQRIGCRTEVLDIEFVDPGRQAIQSNRGGTGLALRASDGGVAAGSGAQRHQVLQKNMMGLSVQRAVRAAALGRGGTHLQSPCA